MNKVSHVTLVMDLSLCVCVCVCVCVCTHSLIPNLFEVLLTVQSAAFLNIC